jgi:hypothetical protein
MDACFDSLGSISSGDECMATLQIDLPDELRLCNPASVKMAVCRLALLRRWLGF